MNYAKLGANGPTVSRLGLGTMMMGWRMNAAESIEVLAKANANGITLIDSSVSYARGACHTMLGQSLKTLGNRNSFVLATKVGGLSDDADPPEYVGVSGKNIKRQCDLSLLQLKTDHIDILQLHVPSDTIEIEEQLLALEKLKSEGKIKYYGICNHSLEQVNKIYVTSLALGLTGLISHQFSYNMLESCNDDLLHQSSSIGLGAIAWGPLSSGILTDWYAENSRLKQDSRISNGRERSSKEALLALPSTQIILQELKQKSAQSGQPVQKLAIQWILDKSAISSVLLGPSTALQLDDLLSD